LATAALATASPSSADTTIGANVDQFPTTSGACAYSNPSRRPCVIVPTAIPGRVTSSPCDGTIVLFRLNGIPSANTYRLRVVRANGDGTYTGMASSAAVSIATDGVNTYPTTLPISTGQYIGIDFQNSAVDLKLRWLQDATAQIFDAFPADGGSAAPTFPNNTIDYLFNADVACSATDPPPGPTPPPSPPGPTPPPSSEFVIGKVKGKALTVTVPGPGQIAVTDAADANHVRAAAAAKPKLLKPSSATTTAAGDARVKLKLTKPAKKTLKAKRKVKVMAAVSFTPSGGTTNTKTAKLKVKVKKG
jgi:hypothetical protein